MKYGLLTLACGLAMISALAGGCKSPPSTDSRSIEVVPQASLVSLGKAMPTVRVELVGLKSAEKLKYDNVNARDWFSGDTTKPDTDLRRNKEGSIFKMRFSAPADTDKKVLSRKDPIWKKWESENILYVMVIADVDTAAGTKANPQEWKQFLPVNDKVDWSKSVIVVKLDTSGLVIETAYEVSE